MRNLKKKTRGMAFEKDDHTATVLQCTVTKRRTKYILRSTLTLG